MLNYGIYMFRPVGCVVRYSCYFQPLEGVRALDILK